MLVKELVDQSKYFYYHSVSPQLVLLLVTLPVDDRAGRQKTPQPYW